VRQLFKKNIDKTSFIEFQKIINHVWVLGFPFRLNLPGTEPSHQRQGVPNGRVSLPKKDAPKKKKTSIEHQLLFLIAKFTKIY